MEALLSFCFFRFSHLDDNFFRMTVSFLRKTRPCSLVLRSFQRRVCCLVNPQDSRAEMLYRRENGVLLNMAYVCAPCRGAPPFLRPDCLCLCKAKRQKASEGNVCLFGTCSLFHPCHLTYSGPSGASSGLSQWMERPVYQNEASPRFTVENQMPKACPPETVGFPVVMAYGRSSRGSNGSLPL